MLLGGILLLLFSMILGVVVDAFGPYLAVVDTVGWDLAVVDLVGWILAVC